MKDKTRIIGIIGAVAALWAVVAFTVWMMPPAKAQAPADEDIVVKKSAIIEMGTKFFSLQDMVQKQDEVIEALQKELMRLKAATNCA